MRDALRGLTTRGRCFLAAGLAAALCSLVLRERDFLRVALLLIALPVISALVVARTRYRLSCTRRLEPPRVQVGQSSEVVLRVENVSRLPTGVLLLEDTLPYTLGGRPRFVLDRVLPRVSRSVRYPVRADVRGRYTVGPLAVRLTDPFGLVELTRAFTSVDRFVVTPQITPLPVMRIGGEWVGGGESRRRSVATSGEDDVATREYRQGDDLRRVHWRSTARVGELMVRREEQPWQSRAAVLLDTRSRAHRGDGPGSSFEWAVSAAASIATHLGQHGFGLRLVTEAGLDLSPELIGSTEDAVLDQLAEIKQSALPSVVGGLDRLRSRGTEGLVIAVLGILTPADAELVASSRTGAGTGVAVLIDAASWIGLSARARAQAEHEHDAVVRLLLAGGWRIVEARHGSSLATIWPAVSVRPDRGAAAARVGAR